MGGEFTAGIRTQEGGDSVVNDDPTPDYLKGWNDAHRQHVAFLEREHSGSAGEIRSALWRVWVDAERIVRPTGEQQPQSIGERLKAARLRRGFSQAVTAAMMNPPISANTVSRWETNTYEISLIDAIKLANIYCVPLEVITGDGVNP
jgi:DNA-binding transcriptional regulator YiaG